MPAGVLGKARLCRTRRRHTAPRRLTHAARRAGARADGPAARGPAGRTPRGSPADRAAPAPPGADGAGRNPTSRPRRQRGCCGAAGGGAAEPSLPEGTRRRAHRSSPLVPPAAVAVRGAGRPVPGQGTGQGRAGPSLSPSGAGRRAPVCPVPAGAMRSCGRTARWAAPLLLLWQCLPTARTYNVDTRHPLLFRGDNGTFFGYSVLLMGHGEERW